MTWFQWKDDEEKRPEARCKSFATGRFLRDQLVLKCSHRRTAALIILKQRHQLSEESNPIRLMHTRHFSVHIWDQIYWPYTDHKLYSLSSYGRVEGKQLVPALSHLKLRHLLGLVSILLLLLWSLPAFVFGLVSFLSSLTRRGKGAPAVVSLPYFLNKFAAAQLQPPRMVIFHFTKVTRSENCGQSGRRALNWGRRLPAVSELLIKTQTASLQNIKLFAHFAMHGIFGNNIYCTLWVFLEEEEDFLTILLSVWM